MSLKLDLEHLFRKCAERGFFFGLDVRLVFKTRPFLRVKVGFIEDSSESQFQKKSELVPFSKNYLLFLLFPANLLNSEIRKSLIGRWVLAADRAFVPPYSRREFMLIKVHERERHLANGIYL